MSREREFNAGGGGGRGGGGPGVDTSGVDVADADGIQSNKPADYGTEDWLRIGYYGDAYEWNVSPTAEEIIKSDVPPGNSYNDDHYATEDGLGAAYNDSSSELIAAVVRIEGQMQQPIEGDIRWYNPDTSIAWETSFTSDPPPSCNYPVCWWEYYHLYSFIGRDFSHQGTPEVDGEGVYAVQFDTNYGNFTDTVEVVGPSATSCQIPDQIQQGGSGEFGVTITKPSDDYNSYNGDVVVARKMTDNYTTRDVIYREPFSISQGINTKAVSFDVPAAKFDEFGGVGSDTPIMLYLETYGF